MAPLYTSQQLETMLFSGADALRGPIDAANFKDYILPMLFLKRILDSYEYEYQQALERGGKEYAEYDYEYAITVPKSAQWQKLIETVDNRGVKVQDMFDLLEENNDKLLGVFGPTQWSNTSVLPEANLQELISIFHRIKLDPVSVPGDLLGDAYEYLLKVFADDSGKKAGEFYTPRFVTRILNGIVDVQSGESVYDPTCGSGGILNEVISHAKETGKEWRNIKVYGQEVSSATASIAKMNMMLHGVGDPNILVGDTLRNPKHLEDGQLKKFDAIEANPPFSLKKWGADNWATDPYGRSSFGGIPPIGCGDFAFVQHMLSSLKAETGRMAIVLPHGVLFRGGTEGKIRQYLLEQDLVEAVIGLPKNLFYNTSIPACVLVCRENKAVNRKDKVLFVDAQEAFQKGKTRNTMSEDNINSVVKAYVGGETIDAAVTELVGLGTIKANDYSLNIGAYISSYIEEIFDISALLAQAEITRKTLVQVDSIFWSNMREANYPIATETEGGNE